jgi:hypothetical protein
MDIFWELVDAEVERLSTAQTADEVVEILGYSAVLAPQADAFFAGGDGGRMLWTLESAGWRIVWYDADYHWALQSPDRQSSITYVEGDVYRGTRVDPALTWPGGVA